MFTSTGGHPVGRAVRIGSKFELEPAQGQREGGGGGERAYENAFPKHGFSLLNVVNEEPPSGRRASLTRCAASQRFDRAAAPIVSQGLLGVRCGFLYNGC